MEEDKVIFFPEESPCATLRPRLLRHRIQRRRLRVAASTLATCTVLVAVRTRRRLHAPFRVRSPATICPVSVAAAVFTSIATSRSTLPATFLLPSAFSSAMLDDRPCHRRSHRRRSRHRRSHQRRPRPDRPWLTVPGRRRPHPPSSPPLAHPCTSPCCVLR